VRHVGLLGLVASIVLVGACVGTTAEPTLDASIVAAVAPACAGQAVAGAGALITDGHALNHVVVLDATGQPFEWSDWTPQEWWPSSTADAELVACVGQRADVQIEVCPYYGSDITRYAAIWPVSAVEPSTGKSVAKFDITANPRTCQRQEDASLTSLRGSVYEEDVQSYLAGLVEHGAFVRPSASPSSTLPTLPAEESAAPSPAVRVVNLSDALAAGSVVVSGTGGGLEKLGLDVTSKLDEVIELVVAAGTLFDPAAKGTQTMMVLWDEPIQLMPGETTSATLDVACVEMHQDQPTTDDTFTVSDAAPNPDLTLLLASPELADADGRVRQFAVWTITNDPKRKDYVPLGTSFDIFGSGPDDHEIAAIRALFDAAGIDTAKYRALR